MTTISSSDGISLHFPTEEELAEYEEKLKELQIATYIKIREKHGIWADNQNKFVKTREELRYADSLFMEYLVGGA